MKRIIIWTLLASLGHFQSAAQREPGLTLEQSYELAVSNYPLVRQRNLIETARVYSLKNAAAGSLPRITVGGQATYQSDVTQIPVEMPGVEPLSKDQYNVFGEISQTLYQGGKVAADKQLEEVNADVEARSHDAEMYQVRSRINELFFGILLLQDQVAQTGLVMDDLRVSLGKIEASIANGVALRSSADVVRVELLRLQQRVVEMESTDEAYRKVLSAFLGRPLDSVKLEKPIFADLSHDIARPEIAMFEMQRRALTASENILASTKRPRVDLFLKGGYGRPGLNMLENDFSLYYVGGVRFSWLLSGYYTRKREMQIIELRRKRIDVQEETFRFNTQLMLTQHAAEIARLQRLIEVDEEIISLRTRVRETAQAQMDQGVITSTDYIREVNAEDQAKQTRALHETQLLMAQANQTFTSGNN